MYQNILILPDGREISSGAEASIRSLKLRELVNSGTDLTIGACCADLLEATVLAQTLELRAGDDIRLVKEHQGNRIPIGVYTLEAPVRSGPHTYRLTAYDHMAKLDKDLTPWLKNLTGWPYGIQDLAALVCARCGVEYRWSESLPNEDFLIEKWSESAVTGRKILGWLGEIACRFVHADPQGAIGFGWYTDSGKHLTHTGSGYYLGGSLRYDGYRVAPIEAVQLRRETGLFPEADPDANSYILTGNPILSACREETLASLLDTIALELSQACYTPGSVSALGDPTVRAGSILHVVDAAGQEIALWVMEKTSTGQRDTYTCTGNPRRNSVAALHSKSASQKAAESALQTDARLTRQALFQKLTAGAAEGLILEDGSLWLNPGYLLPGEILADLTLSGRLFPGEALVVDALPQESEPGRLYLLRTEVLPGWVTLQPYLREERNAL